MRSYMASMSLEMLDLPQGVTGLALNLEQDNVGAVLFGEWEKIIEGDTVKRTKRLLDTRLPSCGYSIRLT
jgi:F-type H+-transporting ATPase subunit alpha